MPAYTYKARDQAGKPVKGTMDAPTREEVVEKLERMGYLATQVIETLPGFGIISFFDKFKRISAEDMIMFNVQLSNMINAGIPILTSLDTLSGQVENKILKDALGDIRRDVEAGEGLSLAMTKHPNIFPELFINMVKAGEASGKLDTVLVRYADFYEHQVDLAQKIKSALFYPAILFFVGIFVILFIVTVIIPQFTQIFTSSGIRLPIPTLVLDKIGIGIKRFWYLAILVIGAVWLGVRYYAKTDIGRLRMDRFKLGLPIIGSLLRKGAISRFARTLATLVYSGVPILQSLDIVKGVIGNRVLSDTIGNVRSSVERGERIAEPLKISEEFPLDTIQMISVGEESGNLDGMLNKISDFYDLALGYTIKRLTSVIEPLFLVVMGVLVGFIMASMLLPIFDMVKILRH